MKSSLGEFPETRCPLNYQETGTYRGDGYQVKNVFYQSRQGFYVTGNLYLPENPTDNMPAIILIPSHHYHKPEVELRDCGMIWARTGCAVLVIDRLGCGERNETIFWNRQGYTSEYLLEMQLDLIGQSRIGWMAWDISRAVDLLYEMGNIDRKRIILIGSVTTGGGMTAGYGGLFDKRIAAVIPFNTGHVYWRGWGVRRSLADKITLWFVYNAIAPRKFIYAHEFSWEGEEGPQFPSVWVPAWPRYKKIYSLYGAEENLATTQGTGLLRAEKLTGGGCVALGPTQREPLYPVLNKWFGIPLPSAKDLDDITDLRVKYSGSRPGYPLLKAKESIRTKPESALLSITPEANARLDRKKLHEIALGMGRELLESARARRAQLELSSGRQALVRDLSSKLGDIQPNRNPEVKSLWMKKLAGAHVEAITLWPEPDIIVPLFIIKPETQGNKPLPLVIAIGEGGKDRFLRDMTRELERLLQNGIAVCLPDVRGTGETAPDQYNRSHDLATNMLELGETLLGLRLKDVLSVLVYLESRNDIDSRKIALWGDSFAPANTEEIWVDELEPQPVSPQIQHFASPMGAHLALLTALYHDEIKAVAARGGLISYLSALEDNFVYFPPDMNVPEILKVGDISDICSSLAPRPLLIESMVDSRNFVVNSEILEREMDSVKEAYKKAGEYKKLMIRQTSEYPEIVSWLIDQLI
ncbi:MAG TPA: acetylxylan esterase [archaeon]|nr:acetylxylan esterase [archaeon]